MSQNGENEKMISKENWYLQIKVSQKTREYINKFSELYNVSVSNFGEYAINSLIADLDYRIKDMNDIEAHFYLNQFADQLNIQYRAGNRS